MKITIWVIITCCLFSLSSVAQNTYSVKGVTADSTSKAKFAATIMILNAKDSILRKYARSGTDGSFSITGLPAGQFILVVTHPDYSEFSTKFTLNPASREHNFGTIQLASVGLMLKEVSIKSEVTAIKIKGDTIEYNAKAYVIQPNDKVEEMLKQLPGFEIDKDGHIKVQGETIRKVLLDGEEFFGDDPTLITRNIRGDMVDKIQFYEKKSDMATATGIEDGKGQKVINVQLKKDKNTGVFGKVLGGAGTDGYYEGQGFANKFTKNYKAAAYGTISNDGKVGLGGADNSRLGTNNNLMVVMAGGVTVGSTGGNSQLDRETYGGQGLPESKTGGAHYDTKWNDGVETLNANYKAGDLSTTTDRNVLTRTTYPTSVENGVSDQHVVSGLNRQKVDGLYTKRYKTGSLRVDVNTSVQNNHDLSNSTSITTNDDGSLKNNNSRFEDTHNQQKALNANLFYSGALKKGFFAWSLQEAYDNTQGKQYLKTQFTTPSAAGNTFVDQFKNSTASGLALGSSMSYSRTLSKKVSLVFNYDINLNNSVSDLASYNQSAPGVYNVLDTTYSSDYKLNQLNNRLGVAFNVTLGKATRLNFGNGANIVSFKQTNENTGYVYQRNFTNWAPRASFSYFVGQSKSANLSYYGSSQQPSINQVQPTANNNNPQSILIGNPNLKPFFTNSFNGGYRSFDQLTGQTFTINGSYSFTSNPIVYNQTHDTVTGKSINQWINLVDKTQQNYSVNLSYARKITPWDMQVSLDLLATHQSSYTPVNGVLTNSLFHYYETGIRLQKNKLKKYSLLLAVVPNWNLYNHVPVNALAPDDKTFNCNIRAEVNFFLPGKLQIGSSFFERIRGPIQKIPNANQTDWSATFSKTLLKEDALKLSLTCNNLLNEGGFVRSNNGTIINQTTYNTIKRFFLFSVSWDFAHFPTIPVKK